MDDHDEQAHSSYHYRVIERAIALIDAPGGRNRPLEELASDMGMSAAHFQRLFSQWVGVSPKRYQQYLLLGHARTLMAEHFTTLDAAQELGLSGSARLHDLFLRWEAMSPGEYARKGMGLVIRYGWFDTPFGQALAMATPKGLCGLAFAGPAEQDQTFADMARRWPRADYIHDPAAPAPHVTAAFARQGEGRLHLMGTPFQIKVWEALLHIPPGHVSTYGEIARRVCSHKAARAVGSAVGRNPIGFVIPCHRCLQGNGTLGGYHWGLSRKRAMLGHEAARRDACTRPTTAAEHIFVADGTISDALR
ncbi:bifunctional helix-turn-helix domain-containing protein/methylated-DNA--[protein]-cysteine S-methyltransferase [Roseinatronobacter alkalisoli]|uniref:Bifunctional helix-turn-helix domain-containing protein/methylated-DNA--[protein]-cysteine S-methyltransferase n=1 Tax=Roseinatronobacter alkalisoli TaxID=3028235 RepID=A0ABT5T7T9_9RHOB|nr:bifunctional helix-turn-helix domain-containing protein/methylated-DNA--[protein]-cysteine S-methyltransferase [Roseinatronobacter sp. HJB301]MDD7971182.1 bifunctional helix-turn-helix domain-containing protein/methylated-DNA--[protein]-cysteine S-methyltransferase [Roseinatronobacter sp. HJB301]